MGSTLKYKQRYTQNAIKTSITKVRCHYRTLTGPGRPGPGSSCRPPGTTLLDDLTDLLLVVALTSVVGLLEPRHILIVVLCEYRTAPAN